MDRPPSHLPHIALLPPVDFFCIGLPLWKHLESNTTCTLTARVRLVVSYHQTWGSPRYNDKINQQFTICSIASCGGPLSMVCTLTRQLPLISLALVRHLVSCPHGITSPVDSFLQKSTEKFV